MVIEVIDMVIEGYSYMVIHAWLYSDRLYMRQGLNNLPAQCLF